MMTTEINKPARPVTAFDRQQVIDLARDELAGWPIGSGYYGTKLDVDEAREMAEAALPVIVAAVLKPIRELHREQFQFCRECDADYPCPTIQLCDEIEAAAKGGE